MFEIEILITVIVAFVALVIGLLAGYIFRKNLAEKTIGSAEQKAKNLLLDAENRCETIKKEITIEAKEEAHRLRTETEAEIRERRAEIQKAERRLIQKEETIDRKIEGLERKEESIAAKEQTIIEKQNDVEDIVRRQTEELERISGYTREEAKALLLSNVEKEVRVEASLLIKDIESKAREEGDKKAKEIITGAIQRCASDHVAESTVSVVPLPNDEMKGRIIGREGRNIRALENATGVDFIVDDTPEAILISSFDPIRREIAKQAMQTLISDGRIHPARIEEVVEKIKANFDNYLKKEGEAAVLEVGIENINPELYYYLGKLKFRSSFGQNVLQHAKEVALIAAMLARELGLKSGVAKRAGLLHDIGKAIDRETEGTHTELSVELVKRHGESKAVQDAIASHHMDCDFNSIEGILIQVADTISAARPGARREILETYIKRLEKLEELSKSFSGVSKAFAFQAGREVRVIVNANELDDNRTYLMSKDIARKVQEEMEYPGQIKVTVIREVRAIEYAK